MKRFAPLATAALFLVPMVLSAHAKPVKDKTGKTVTCTVCHSKLPGLNPKGEVHKGHMDTSKCDECHNKGEGSSATLNAKGKAAQKAHK
jgi:hypothetical protein